MRNVRLALASAAATLAIGAVSLLLPQWLVSLLWSFLVPFLPARLGG